MTRWLRIDVNWSSTEWVANLQPEGRLAWIEFLCYIKAYGLSGRTRAMATARIAAILNVSGEAFEEMLAAAVGDGAVQLDGTQWVVTNWHKYQLDESNAERQKRHRESKKDGSTVTPALHNSNVTLRNDYRTGQDNDNTGHRQDRTNARESDFPDSVSEVEAYATSIGKTFDARRFFEHYDELGWVAASGSPIKDWKRAVRSWIRRDEERTGKSCDIKPPVEWLVQ